MENKKADSRLLTPWMFFVIGLIGITIVFGVVVFFSGNADVRIREAKSLSNQLVYAISDNGYLKPQVLETGYNILDEAGLNSKAMDNNGYFYFNMSIYDFGELNSNLQIGDAKAFNFPSSPSPLHKSEGLAENGKLVKSFLKGNADFEIQCRLNGDKLAKCYEREFILLNKSNPSRFIKIKILSGSNNKGV